MSKKLETINNVIRNLKLLKKDMETEEIDLIKEFNKDPEETTILNITTRNKTPYFHTFNSIGVKKDGIIGYHDSNNCGSRIECEFIDASEIEQIDMITIQSWRINDE